MSLRSHHHGGGSSTNVIELQERKPSDSAGGPARGSSQSLRMSLSNQNCQPESANDDRNETLPSPITSAEQPVRWNQPRINVFRTFAAFFSLFVLGANDAAYGALIPYLEEYYDLSYTVIALAFLSPLVGYTLSALLNNWIHLTFGQRGVAIIGPGLHAVAYVLVAIHPPWPVLVVVFMLAGFGNGLLDAAWNAWIGNMAQANEVLGFLHAFYGLGAVLAPLTATTLVTKARWPWYTFYYFMLGAAVIELGISVAAFWTATATSFREANARTSDKKGSRMKEALTTAPAARVTWLCALFLLGYVGVEVALGGWIVLFMIRVRDADAFASGMTATGFWLGITVGRVVLGFVTPRVGEKLAISIYLPITMGLELLFWLVPQFYVSAVAVSFQGFFLGPLFPAAVIAATKLLPRHMHVSAVGFAAAFGGGGAAIFPFAVGAIAQAKGVQVLQPIILALLGVILGLWLCLPRMNRKAE
ncbi:major facilitator superfamily domain-containing protein [Lineolata rhizophorae]|uniref:Major facilitator superfamily domain-containing protein n=1 Tax=Lineolata rhizophorae TaxID=578093 RepID=A0A6A6PBN1_9PEZI|nr:major facilitator superfamily domain-containing protein [Lineolata rhizophorae]